MPSDSGQNRRPSKPQNPGAPPAEQEHLPCPRCDSTNTKFCYYNNYNLSQPRHFCKSCRRYWTHGGTLRDIPIGGGSRKNAKHSRNVTATSSITTTSASTHNHPLHTTPVFVPIMTNQGASMPFGGIREVYSDFKSHMNMCGSFSSLLNNTTQEHGFLALGGFGIEDMEFRFGRGGWPNNTGVGVEAPSVENSWQLENGEGGFVGGDFLSWPGLTISTHGNGLK